jgi:hypothetical protein
MDPLARMPYSVSRLLKLCKTWSFYSEAEDRLGDCDDGEPRVSRAHRRIREWLQQWRDSHDADAEPCGARASTRAEERRDAVVAGLERLRAARGVAVKPKTTLRKALADPQLLAGALAGDSWSAWRTLLTAAMGEPLEDAE